MEGEGRRAHPLVLYCARRPADWVGLLRRDGRVRPPMPAGGRQWAPQ